MPVTELVFDPIAFAWAVAGLVVGLIIGRIAFGGRRRVVSVADTAALNAARADADARGRELAAAQAAMRPLADEVDRLKRELARARRPVQTPLPLAAETPAVAPHVEPTPAVAGAGPVVVGDAAPAVTDVRQLKGVGDKFAAALAAIGLTSVDRIARLNPEEASEADTRLGSFNGRIARDQLVDQCILLDEGRTTEYEARFGKIGGPVLV
ncbi:MAG: hypothetical protein JO290_06820 [Sphingomonadaceae bacterium]|nr:hypothetical protein [Sphingomonadaceae bacterium]